MSNARTSKVVAAILGVVAVAFVASGAVAWAVVSNNLAAQHVTVSPISDENPGKYAGEPVDGPITAYAQQQVIEDHILEATGGKTFAEMDRFDPEEGALRATMVQPGEALRAGLFTSILAFGVSALVIGLGVIFGAIAAVLAKRA